MSDDISKNSDSDARTTSGHPLPTLFIPHGGGPCFFMDWTMGPADTWFTLKDWLATVPSLVGIVPKAMLVVSGHWETRGFAVTGGEHPSLIYDYSGFPAHTYQLRYPAPGSPSLARRVQGLVSNLGVPVAIDEERGFDHGTFIPLMVAFPEANIPVVQLSLDRSLDPALHIEVGKALAPLRREGVLIVGSGMSYHNLRGFFSGGNAGPSTQFDAWLTEAVTEHAGASREEKLKTWALAPGGREAHPREEHLLPLMVAAGAADGELGRKVFSDRIMGHLISAYSFGEIAATSGARVAAG